MSDISALTNTAELTAALVRQIKEHPSVVEGGFKEVVRGEYANRDESLTPWCGVYRTQVSYIPKVLGQHNKSFQALLTVKLIVQAHAGTGAASEDACEEAVQRVMTAVLSDLSVSNNVGTLKSVEVEYSYDETSSKTIDFQWAFITLVYETRTGT